MSLPAEYLDSRCPGYAILFDIDGVLVDSYQAHLVSWQRLAKRYGRQCTEADFARGFGRTTRDVLLDQWRDAELSVAMLQSLDEEKEAFYREEISAHFPAMPGARELMAALHEAGWKIGLGSSGPVENVRLAIEKLELASLLGVAISGADVTHGKPHPEVFLKGAEGLGMPPERCLVVEDAPQGVEAAHAACMKCIGFISRGRSAEELAEADWLISSLTELSPSRLQQMLDGATSESNT